MAASHEESIVFTVQELKALVSATVVETLVKLGVDAENPIEMQRDFSHLREWRQTTESLKRRGALAVLSMLLAGGAAALWLGIKALVTQ